MAATTSQPRDDRVLAPTRVLALVIVPILTVAWVMLWIYPDHAGDLFAWPVKPPASAAMLGATYLGGAWFFGRVVVARAWHTVTLGFLPVTAFASVLGISTVLHWDKFTPGHPSFILWAILYFSLPFVVPFVWWRNARNDPGPAVGGGRVIDGPVRLLAGALGLVLTAVALSLVADPALLIPAWPWTLTPLTARVLGAMFALSGIVGIELAIDRRPGAARAIVQAQAIAVAGILIGLARSGGDVAWDAPAAWLFVGGMLAVVGVNAAAAYGTPGGASHATPVLGGQPG